MEHTWEAVKVNGTEKGEEFNAVLRELGEILIDHL